MYGTGCKYRNEGKRIDADMLSPYIELPYETDNSVTGQSKESNSNEPEESKV